MSLLKVYSCENTAGYSSSTFYTLDLLTQTCRSAHVKDALRNFVEELLIRRERSSF